MKLRFQFGAALAAFLVAGLFCSPVFGQVFQRIGQTAAQERRAERRERRRQLNGPNAMLPGANPGNLNNLPPNAFERLRDMPPDRKKNSFRTTSASEICRLTSRRESASACKPGIS